MEHEANNSGSFTELPQPQETPGQAMSENNPAVQPEAVGMQAPTTTPQSQKMDPVAIPIPQPLPPIGSTTVQTDQASAQSSALMADDADLIEKEWVVRAKAIVTQTKDDPHKQNQEMNKVKADYLKKRYNKDLKISES